MILDASVVDFLLGDPMSEAAEAVAEAVAEHRPLAAPDLLDVEVVQVVRRFTRANSIAVETAHALVRDLADLPVARYPTTGLVARAFELRNNVTINDGVYLALAEALDARLLTGDSALARAPGCSAVVRVVSTGSSVS